MSKKTKNKETENVQNAPETNILKPNKQKHNSKRRRCKKNKTLSELESGSEISKVDEVVNYLCSTIIKNDSESSLRTEVGVRINEKSPNLLEVSSGQSHIPNSKCNNTNQLLSSTQDLSSVFENLQIHASKNPINNNNNINDFLNVDLLKKNKCEFLLVKDLERLKEKKLMKTCSLNEEKTSISNENLKEYFNLKLIQDSPNTSVLAQIDSSSIKLVSEIEHTFYSDSLNVKEKLLKSNCLKEYFNVDALMKDKNNIVTSIKSTSKLLVKELENKLLKSEAQENSKKFQKKKTRHKKIKDSVVKNQCSNYQKVFLNSDLQKSNFNESTSSEPSQSNKNRQSQHSSKSFPAKKDTKFPKYLSSEEIQSLSNFGILLTGIIRINQKNYKEAYITAPDKGMDIVIEGLRDRNRALEGDEVYFVLKAKEHHRVSTDSTDIQRTAIVVGIKTFNHNRRAIGTFNILKNKNNNFILFSPRDPRLPRIRIKKSNWPEGFSENSENFKNKLYFAKISQWNDLRYADGEILKEVGMAGDLSAETDAILLKYGLNVTPYSEHLKQFIPINFRISESDIQNREDFRKYCVFTIDPQSAVDLDDAVSCNLLPNGNFEVGVHISDVSFFLEEGTPLDKAVCERATTVYLVQKAYHMLPFELCQVCSLTPGEDKLSFSVMWEVTPDFKILKNRFTRSVINSCAQLSYEQVQAIIDNLPSVDLIFPKIHGGHCSENIKKIIRILHKIAVCLRKRRFSNGALRIDQKKIHFTLDENELPIDYKEETHQPSHQLIEEFMLLANVTVAEKLNSDFPKLAFLRSHPPPLPYVLEKLQKTLEKYGIILDISSSGSIQASLLKYSGYGSESVARMLVINNALAKPMARAKYYCGGLFLEEIDRRHYALSVPLYTHFTSPIRRYADIMVHRLLAASLDYCNTPNWKAEHVQFIATKCNKQKYAAKMAQEMSVELYFSLFIGLQGTMICEAVVCDIKDKSFDCIGLSTGIHQRIYFEHIKGDFKKEKQDGLLRLIIKWPKSENHDMETLQIVEMFSIVKIELKRVNILKVEAELLRTRNALTRTFLLRDK